MVRFGHATFVVRPCCGPPARSVESRPTCGAAGIAYTVGGCNPPGLARAETTDWRGPRAAAVREHGNELASRAAMGIQPALGVVMAKPRIQEGATNRAH